VLKNRREEKEKKKKMTAEKTMIITNKKLIVRIDCEKREEKIEVISYRWTP
jgi:hypothetical protein